MGTRKCSLNFQRSPSLSQESRFPVLVLLIDVLRPGCCIHRQAWNRRHDKCIERDLGRTDLFSGDVRHLWKIRDMRQVCSEVELPFQWVRSLACCFRNRIAHKWFSIIYCWVTKAISISVFHLKLRCWQSPLLKQLRGEHSLEHFQEPIPYSFSNRFSSFLVSVILLKSVWGSESFRLMAVSSKEIIFEITSLRFT